MANPTLLQCRVDLRWKRVCYVLDNNPWLQTYPIKELTLLVGGPELLNRLEEMFDEQSDPN